MKKLLLLLLFVPTLFAQPISLGVKIGTPVTDAFDTLSRPGQVLTSDEKRYTFGPTFELHLPFRFSVEIDALYKRFSFQGVENLVDTVRNTKSEANSWEVPLLLKYRFKGGVLRPYVDSGVSFNTLTGITELGNFFQNPPIDKSNLDNRVRRGFVLGGGVEIKIPFLRISPEVRWTRWGWNNFHDVEGLLHSNDNQAEFLLGITF